MRLTSNHLFWTISLALLAASTFFTISITSFKQGLNISGKSLSFDSGQEALVAKVIDGDEISIIIDNQQAMVRLLGIYSFDPTVNDPMSQNIGKSAYAYLTHTILSKTVSLVFPEFKKDANHRILAYVCLGDRDIGKDMISKGLVLTYLKYPFSRQNDYLAVEKQAKQSKIGLWGNPKVAKRSIQLQNQWKNDREGGAQS